MQGIQLVYFYLLSSEYTDLNNIELTFSNKFKFHIEKFHEESLECKILIRKNEKLDIINEEFWGEEGHVSRVDLLVGENGAGKSTIMNYLSGRGSGKWFLIYLQEDGENLNWYYQTDADFSISIEIVAEWNMKKSIIPIEIDDAPFACYYKPNLIARNWTCDEYNPDNSGLISTNRPSAIYNFVKYELKLLQKYFPAENLTYEFTIPVDFHFIQQLLRKNEIIPDLKNILKTAVFMINEYSDYELNIISAKWPNSKKIDEDYVTFRQYSEALLLGCFNQDRFSNKTINLLKMIIYVCWIIHCVINLKNIIDLEWPGNINSIVEYNNYLRKTLNGITKRRKTTNKTIKIIKEYIGFDFVEKLFFTINMEWVKIQVKSTATVEFEIFLHEKVNEEVDKNVIDLINFTDKIKSCHKDDNIKLMRVGFNNMSSGEMEYIDLFASIYANFSFKIIRDDDDDDKYDFEIYSKATNYLFILDEPDAAFHPEWSRKLIYYLTTFINKLLIGTNKKCQLIITTHSPFMVSDMPSEYVTCINLKVDEKGTYYRTIKKPTHSFAANIYELLNDGFFMDAPIGEFAQHKIQKVIDRMNILENLQNEDLMNEIEYITKMINMVSDKLVRGRLNDMFEKKKKILLDDKSTNVLEYLLTEIKELKREIVELKSKENNGEKK